MLRSACSAVFLLVLVACGGEPAPTSEVPTPEVAAPATPEVATPAPARVPAAPAGRPRCVRADTPDGLAYEGRGRRWTQLFGGSTDDFPGPAAVLATVAGAGPLTTLQETDRGEVCEVPLADGGLGYAATLTRGAIELARGDLFAAIDRRARAGASVVFVPAAEAAGDPEALCAARVAASHRDAPFHLGVDATLDSIPWPVLRADAPEAKWRPGHATLLRLRGVTAADAPALRLIAELLRSDGGRLVIDAGLFAGAPDALAELIVAGVVLELGAEPDEDLERALRLLRRDAGLVGEPRPAVALVVDPERTPLPDLVAARARLDSLRVPPDVVVPSWPNVLRERLDRAPLVAFGGGLSPTGRAVVDELAAARTVLDVAALEPGSAAAAAFGIDLDVAGVRAVRRFEDPGTGRLVHHLFAPGAAEAGTLRADAFRDGDFAGCRAALLEPFAGTSRTLACVAGEGGFEVRTGAFRSWGVVTIEGVPPHPRRVAGREVVGVVAGTSADSDRWTELTLEAPEWPAGSIALGFPEWLRSEAGPLDQFGGPLVPAYEPIEGGVGFVASNELVRVTGTLLGRPDGLDATLAVTNVGAETLPGVEALICLETDPARPFPESGHARTFVARGDGMVPLREPVDSGDPLYVETDRVTHPLTVLTSADERWVLANAFAGSTGSGGNALGPGVCVHSRPRFGDVAPGATVERRGRLWIGRGTADEVLADYLEVPLEPTPRAVEPSRWRRPCAPAP